MPYLKRPSSDDDDNGSSDDGVIGHDARRLQRKRSRLSNTAGRESHDIDISEYGLEIVPNGAVRQTPTPDDSEEEKELDEDTMAQLIHKHMEKLDNNVASECGIIEEVYCQNFMCHASLRIKLGPLINFIIGHNGSGKSAVLTALRVCLGGKAADRGGSLKANIKSGEDNAILAVKIKNRGDGAYRPEVYGRSITVERQFWKSGRAVFKLKSEKDRVISNKRADLEDILDYFALHLDNPINVLSQEEARNFLSNSTPTSKYMFFLKGTQLEALDQDYNLIEEKLDSQEEALRQRAEDLEVLRQKARDAEANKKRVEQLRKLGEKQNQVRSQMAWCQVIGEEKALEQRERDCKFAEEVILDKEQAAETASGIYEGHDQSYEAAIRAHSELQSGAQALEEDHTTKQADFNEHYQKLLNVQTQQRTIKDTIKATQSTMQRLQKEIDLEQARLADAHGTAHTDRVARLAQLEDARVEARSALDAHAKQQSELEGAVRNAANDMDAAKPAHHQAQDAVKSAKLALDRLQADQGNPLAPYHDSYRNVLRDINRETRWRMKPVGPLGMHVHLLKPEWSSQLETTFGGALNAFAVTCREDEIILSRILQQHSCRAAINIGNNTPLDTSDKEPQDDVDTILRVLRIDSDLVRNSLIINHFIEQVVLIKDSDRAYSYMYDGARRRNVKAVIAFAAQRGSGTRYEFTASGAQKSGPVRTSTAPPRMKVDREAQLRQFNDRWQQAKLEEDELHQRNRQLQATHNKAQQAVQRFKRELQSLRLDSQRAEDAVEELQNEIDANRPQDGKLQELERQLAEEADQLVTARGSYQDSVLAKDSLGEAGRHLKTALDDAKAALEDLTAKINKAQIKINKVDAARHNALLTKNEAIADVEYAKNEVQRRRAKIEDQKGRVADFERQATVVSQRVHVDEGMTYEKLDALRDKLGQEIERIEQAAGGTAEELTRVWKEAVLAYRDAVKQTEEMKKVCQTMKRALTERLRRWHLFRKYISYRAKITFVYLLSERGFRGRLTLDHSAKRLEIAIEPDLTKVSDDGRGAESLSGGERSYSTVCLLLSIWEAMGSPIRCLDEFDVCMDSANRATSMGMMIQAARRSVGRQFVLITPLSMDGVELGQDVQVHRMRDPERGTQR